MSMFGSKKAGGDIHNPLIDNREASQHGYENEMTPKKYAPPTAPKANGSGKSGKYEAAGSDDHGDASAGINDIGEDHDSKSDAPFVYSHGLTSKEAERLLDIHGKNELPEKIVPKWYIFISQLWQPMPVMIWIAALVECAIQNWIDMSILLFIQFANASIGYYEITKAGDAVAALKSQLQAKATVKRDGSWMNINANLVVPGDLCLLAAGSAVPADCRVNEGQIEVDQAALTGESLPVTMYQGDSCKMGSTVSRGEY
jgi:H+-transporting ATPase